MRVLIFTSVLVLLAASSAAQAQRRPSTNDQPKAETSTPYASKESSALADEVRERSEALERARDLRMKRITRGICTGC